MTKIIGVCGFAQHGKNSVAEAVVEFLQDQEVEIIAFADALRAMARAIGDYVIVDDEGLTYNRSLDTVGYERTKAIYPKARVFLQKLGTEAVRDNLGKDAWINALALKIDQTAADVVVVPDVRFENEVRFIKENGHLWAVTRPGFDNGLSKEHPSEAWIEKAKELAEVSFNADSLVDLRTQVYHYLKKDFGQTSSLGEIPLAYDSLVTF